MMELDQEYSKEELNFSRPLDRHRISEHPEVKTFLKDFQQTYFPKYGKPRRKKLRSIYWISLTILNVKLLYLRM